MFAIFAILAVSVFSLNYLHSCCRRKSLSERDLLIVIVASYLIGALVTLAAITK